MAALDIPRVISTAYQYFGYCRWQWLSQNVSIVETVCSRRRVKYGFRAWQDIRPTITPLSLGRLRQQLSLATGRRYALQARKIAGIGSKHNVAVVTPAS